MRINIDTDENKNNEQLEKTFVNNNFPEKIAPITFLEINSRSPQRNALLMEPQLGKDCMGPKTGDPWRARSRTIFYLRAQLRNDSLNNLSLFRSVWACRVWRTIKPTAHARRSTEPTLLKCLRVQNAVSFGHLRFFLVINSDVVYLVLLFLKDLKFWMYGSSVLWGVWIVLRLI